VNTLATYGTGFIFGPFVRKEVADRNLCRQFAVGTQIKETKYEFDFRISSWATRWTCTRTRKRGILAMAWACFG
jgi:hypothetical protein